MKQWNAVLAQYLDGEPSAMGSLERRMKKHHPDLHTAIMNSWSLPHTPVSFLERVYQFLTPTDVVCKYGNTMRFEYFRTGYRCKKTCPCTAEKHRATMMSRYGVESPLQHPEIQHKQQRTLEQRYGTAELHQVSAEKKAATCMQRYGTSTPLESPVVRAKAAETFVKNTGFSTPFERINSSPELQQRAKQARNRQLELAYPEKYDYDTIISVVEQHSYAKAAEILGLYPTHIKNIVARSGRSDLLPKKSSYERLVGDFLNNHGIGYIQNTRKVIAPFELDFYIPDRSVAIEVHGLRWHSESFGNKHRHYHLNKHTQCAQQGCKLIQVFNDEIDNRPHTVFSILKTVLGIPKRVLYARKLQLVQTPYADVAQFVNQHHLQGMCPASVYYCLRADQQIVAAMTFKRTHGAEYELSRYCVHSDYSIVGAAQRMFAQFVRNYQFAQIITYSDNRYFSGDLYSTLGFVQASSTPPNYWYLTADHTQREHRLKYTKQKLLKQFPNSAHLSEWEIMKQQGRDRIWDCGSTRWIYNPEKL
jgi:very-short-patch-repair endonuclease